MRLQGTQSYNLSFTAASLRPELMRIAAEIFLACNDWEEAKRRILATNAFQCRASRSAAVLERELRQRLQLLTLPQLHLLAKASAEDRAAMSWLASCKRSSFLFDFAAGILRDKLDALDPILRLSDYESYLDLQSVAHPSLGTVTPSSRTKIRQVLFKMLREAGLTTQSPPSTLVHRPVLSPAVTHAILTDDPSWLSAFLVPAPEINRL